MRDSFIPASRLVSASLPCAFPSDNAIHEALPLIGEHYVAISTNQFSHQGLGGGLGTNRAERGCVRSP